MTSPTIAFKPIIESLLDTDLYKLTMMQAMLHTHPANSADYRFVCRNQPEFPLVELESEVNAQLDHLCTLSYSEADLEYLATRPYFKSDFLDFLRIFRFQRKFIQVVAVGDTLVISAKGPQLHVMAFEIFVLSIVNELYFRRFDQETALTTARARLQTKIATLKAFAASPRSKLAHPFEFFDFGVRRRFSREWQTEMVRTLQQEVPQFFKGTSNVYLARQFGLTPIGTMAHEYLQTFQATGVQLKNFQRAALEAWVQEYRGDLGIALTDVVGMDAFLQDFDRFFGLLFDGLRHDSGDPVVWGEKALAHYAKLKLDAHTKRLVFSDGLDIPTALSLYETFGDRVQTGFGIGTNLSNDTGNKPLNIVMKLVMCNGQPTAKLSDSPGKTMCADETFLAYLRQVFNVSQ